MADILGVNVPAGVRPFTTDDTYDTHDALYGKGGWRSVADTTARDAIPAARRTEGMVVYSIADTTEYVLAADLTTWSPKPGGSGTLDHASLTSGLPIATAGHTIVQGDDADAFAEDLNDYIALRDVHIRSFFPDDGVEWNKVLNRTASTGHDVYIQNAIDYLETRGGGRLLLSVGTYSLSARINITSSGIRLWGEGGLGGFSVSANYGGWNSPPAEVGVYLKAVDPFTGMFAITQFSDAGVGEVTATATGSNFGVGQAVGISGTDNYNDTHIITAATADTFTFVATWAGDDATGKVGDHYESVIKVGTKTPTFDSGGTPWTGSPEVSGITGFGLENINIDCNGLVNRGLVLGDSANDVVRTWSVHKSLLDGLFVWDWDLGYIPWENDRFYSAFSAEYETKPEVVTYNYNVFHCILPHYSDAINTQAPPLTPADNTWWEWESTTADQAQVQILKRDTYSHHFRTIEKFYIHNEYIGNTSRGMTITGLWHTDVNEFGVACYEGDGIVIAAGDDLSLSRGYAGTAYTRQTWKDGKDVLNNGIVSHDTLGTVLDSIGRLIPYNPTNADELRVYKNKTGSTITMGVSPSAGLEGASAASSCVISWANHGLSNGDSVTITGVTQNTTDDWTILNGTHTIADVVADVSFSIPVDTSTLITVPYAPSTDNGTVADDRFTLVGTESTIARGLVLPWGCEHLRTEMLVLSSAVLLGRTDIGSSIDFLRKVGLSIGEGTDAKPYTGSHYIGSDHQSHMRLLASEESMFTQDVAGGMMMYNTNVCQVSGSDHQLAGAVAHYTGDGGNVKRPMATRAAHTFVADNGEHLRLYNPNTYTHVAGGQYGRLTGGDNGLDGDWRVGINASTNSFEIEKNYDSTGLAGISFITDATAITDASVSLTITNTVNSTGAHDKTAYGVSFANFFTDSYDRTTGGIGAGVSGQYANYYSGVGNTFSIVHGCVGFHQILPGSTTVLTKATGFHSRGLRGSTGSATEYMHFDIFDNANTTGTQYGLYSPQLTKGTANYFLYYHSGAFNVDGDGNCTAPEFIGGGASLTNVDAVTSAQADTVATATNGDNATYRVPFISDTSGDVSVYNDGSLNYNPNSNLLSTANITASVAATLGSLTYNSTTVGGIAKADLDTVTDGSQVTTEHYHEPVCTSESALLNVNPATGGTAYQLVFSTLTKNDGSIYSVGSSVITVPTTSKYYIDMALFLQNPGSTTEAYTVSLYVNGAVMLLENLVITVPTGGVYYPVSKRIYIGLTASDTVGVWFSRPSSEQMRALCGIKITRTD